MVILFVIVAALVTVAIWVTTMPKGEERATESNPIPLIYPVRNVDHAADQAPAWPPASFETPRVSPPPRPKPAARPAQGGQKPQQVTRAREVELAIVPTEEPDVSPTVHFRRPVEQPVQLLPGRLEVLAGEQRHKEIRLVRVPGERPEVILGRERIDAPGHVALQSSTVSRRHARLAYADGVWKVANLSQTNPVVINDEALPADHERTLADGDCLELGEVVLRFHTH
jgi:hypothetical protein